MAKNDQEEAYDKALIAALARTIDMVKYAETKNAALLTFSSAWIVGSVNLLTTKSPLALGYDLAFQAALPLFGASALISLCSFLPKLNPGEFFRRRPVNAPLNLLFFGDLAALGADGADQILRAAYHPTGDRSATDRYLSDLACQVAVNSCIAARKFGLFNKAAWLDALAMGFLAIPALRALLMTVLP